MLANKDLVISKLKLDITNEKSKSKMMIDSQALKIKAMEDQVKLLKEENDRAGKLIAEWDKLKIQQLKTQVQLQSAQEKVNIR